MVHEIEVDVTDQVVGADQRNLFRLGEIAEIEKAEFAEANKNSSRPRIFGGIEIPLRLTRAVGIRGRGYAGARFDVSAASRENDDAEAGDVDDVTGMNGAARRGANGLDVGRQVVARDVGVFAVDAVIEELADLDMLNEIRHAAYMIGVEVGDEHLVDHRTAGVFHCRLNALGIAAIVAGPAGIDQQRVTAWRDKQRGLAALDINGVNLQIFRGRLRLRLLLQNDQNAYGDNDLEDEARFEGGVGRVSHFEESVLDQRQPRKHPGDEVEGRMPPEGICVQQCARYPCRRI